MKLNLVQKQSFYYELGQFLKSGIGLPQAVEALAPETGNGPLRQILLRLQKLFLSGESVPSAFAQLRPAIGEMEVALISASSNSGRLEVALAYLSDYFGTLEELRATIVKKLTWPIVQLHIGVFILPVAQAIVSGDWTAYFVHCGAILGTLYAVGIALWMLAAFLAQAAQTSTGVDRLLRMIPLVGALRRNMALNRFCATYEMQLQAAVNLMDSLRSAADASQSALMRAEVTRVIPKVRAGSAFAPLIAGSRVFPAALQRVFRIGEETGTLDEDLRKWADYYRGAAMRKIEALGSWIPRIIGVMITLYIGYTIFESMKTSLVDPVNDMLKQM